jgi:PAS domain S-box-containing protein
MMNQAAEDSYRGAVEATLSGIWVVDGLRRTNFVSPRMAAMLGYAPDDMVGKPVCAFVDAGASDAFLDPPGKSDVQLLRKDGSTVWVSISSGPLPQSDGTPGGVAALVTDVTERRRYTRSNEHLAAIVDSSEDAITDTALGGIITSWNRGAERLYGYTAAEAIGQSIEMIIPLELRGELTAILARLAQGEQVEPRETVRIARDGRRIDVSLRWSVLFDAHGRPTGGVGAIGRDITDRKQTEAALRESEARKSAILEAALDCIISMDGTGRITEFNSAAEQTFGRRRADVLGQDMAELIIPHRFRESHRTGLMRLLATGQSQALNQRLELAALRADGTEFPVELAIVRSESADHASFTGYLRDITDRKQAEAALHESQERYRRQYKGIPIPTYSWRQVDDDFVMVDFNDAAATTSGNVSSWLGSRASTCLGELSSGMAALRECVAQQRTIRREAERPHRVTGEPQSIALSYVFVPPDMVMVHIEDVTEARHTERQRAALAQSEKLRALGQMASGIAHDLNQSLMLISSYGELAHQALDQDPLNVVELRDLLTTATQAALDGGETVKRLLMFTRTVGERGHEQVDLTRVLHRAAHLTAPRWRDVAQVEGRPISLHVEAEGQPIIVGSAARIRDVITNLIFNAVDALPAGGSIRLRAAVDEGVASVEISDSGIGMTPEVQARVFEPFFTTKGESGTGLGLAMVFGIVEQHGGEITVHSTPGAGTTFRMTFPHVQVAVPVAGLPTPLESVATQRPARALRVLAVDDEPAMTKAVSRMLRPAGHLVKTAASGEEALELLAVESFDVVVSDMGMGSGMNGWELVSVVKRDWPSMRFLLATGWGAGIDLTEARTRGVEAILAKPYSAADLLRALAVTSDAA